MKFTTELETKDIDAYGEQEFLKNVLRIDPLHDIEVNSITAIIDWEFYYETRDWGVKEIGAYATGLSLHIMFDTISNDEEYNEDNEVEIIVGSDKMEIKDITYKGSGIEKTIEAVTYRAKNGYKEQPDFLDTEQSEPRFTYCPERLEIDFKYKGFPSFIVQF
jgi:hypothetical protein